MANKVFYMDLMKEIVNREKEINKNFNGRTMITLSVVPYGIVDVTVNWYSGEGDSDNEWTDVITFANALKEAAEMARTFPYNGYEVTYES